MTNPYEIAYPQSIEDPDTFWAKAAEDCHWYKKWDKVLDDSNKPFYRWFTGGETNTCYNAVDYHIDNGRGEQDAIIYDSPVTDTIKKYTYIQLRDEVAGFAGALAPGGRQRRSGAYLHADDSGGRFRHAGLRAHRCRTFGCVRRFCRQGTGRAHQ